MNNPEKTGAYQPESSESLAANATQPQHINRFRRKMMRKSGQHHPVLAFVALVALLGFASYEGHSRVQAHTLGRSLLDAAQPQALADLLMDADEKQFAVLFAKFKEQGEGLPVLYAEIDRKLPPDAKDEAKEKLAKRQANAAVALLKMNQPTKVWPLLKHSPDPRVRSYLIHRLGPLGTDAKAIVERLATEPDVTIRRAFY